MMKQLKVILIVLLLYMQGIQAQTPSQFKYQAVLRDTNGEARLNQSVSVEVSILKGSPVGEVVFSEMHSLTTNELGLININIGSINDLSVINWAGDTYFIQISVDGNIMGTSQLLSVPYALSVKKAETYDETDPVFSSWDKSTGINITEEQIVDLKNYLTVENDPSFTVWDKSAGISITESQIIDLKNYLTEEVDGDITNEIQDLSIQDNILRTTHNENATNIDLNVYLDNTDSQDIANVLEHGNSADNKQIKNVAIPSDTKDLATKNYVDEMLLQAGIFPLKDVDGNVYKAVKIGDQIWMAEDLRVTHYPNGDPIPEVEDNYVWGDLLDNNIDDAYCFYENDDNTEYGALYTYAAAIGDNWQRDNDTLDDEGGQGICPDGWHLPTDAEWTQLTDYLGGLSVAGGKMKERGLTHWTDPNEAATNSSGFTALPGGYRSDSYGTFSNLGNLAYWWTTYEQDDTHVYARNLRYSTGEVIRSTHLKSIGFHVRCIKN